VWFLFPRKFGRAYCDPDHAWKDILLVNFPFAGMRRCDFTQKRSLDSNYCFSFRVVILISLHSHLLLPRVRTHVLTGGCHGLPLGERAHAFGGAGWQSFLKGKLQLTYSACNKMSGELFYGRLKNFLATLAMNTNTRNFPGAIEQG